MILDLLFGFGFFALAWAGGIVADGFRDRLLRGYDGAELKQRLRDIVFILWFSGCFLAAGYFLGRH